MPLFDKHRDQSEQQPQGGWPAPAPQPEGSSPALGVPERADVRREARGAAARAETTNYATSVNKGSRNMAALAGELNQRWNAGWRLHTIFEKDGNTVCVFERRD